MSRYGDPRYSGGNVASREPPAHRWDADRFARERDYRQAPPPEDYYAPSPRRAARPAPVYEEQKYYEEERYGPRGSRQERRYFEEEDYYADPRAGPGQMIPYRPAAPARPAPAPRPGLLRRQSSLDTFDRPPQRRFDDYEATFSPPRRRPERVVIPIPEAPNPRGNRYRPDPPRAPRQEYRDYYDDVAVQDPEYYGDDGFREYREREWVSRRRRSGSRERRRSKSRSSSRSSGRSKAKTEIIDEKRTEKIVIKPDGEIRITEKEEIKEEKEEEKKGEKPFPRRGKTKMPKRLVHTKVLFDLGYPYYEENEKTIIIEKALGPDNIDEVFVKSREYREREVGTTRLIEAPPAPSSVTTTVIVPDLPRSSAHSVRPPSPREEFREEIVEEIITRPMSQAPRSVREWDALSVHERAPTYAPSHAPSRQSYSRRDRRSPSPEVRETIIEKREEFFEREPSPARTYRSSRQPRRSSPEIFIERREEIIERDLSPARTHKSGRTRRRESFNGTEIIERKIITEEDVYDREESNSVHVGPLALVVDRSKPRSDREIKEEIARLQQERRTSRREREYERDDEFVRIERRKSRPPSPVGEVIIERRGEEIVEVKKDKRERSKSRVRPPSSNLIKNLMYTLT